MACLAVATALGTLAGLHRPGTPDRSAAIERVAAHHARQQGPAPCAGRPGAQDSWLVVTCGQGDRLRVYRVDRSGRIEGADAGGI